MTIRFILLFPFLLIPAAIMFMVRPWVILEDMEKGKLLGVRFRNQTKDVPDKP